MNNEISVIGRIGDIINKHSEFNGRHTMLLVTNNDLNWNTVPYSSISKIFPFNDFYFLMPLL